MLVYLIRSNLGEIEDSRMTGQNTVTKNVNMVKAAFRKYYFEHGELIEEPNRIETREFGYSEFGQLAMNRHLSFRNIKELNAMLVKKAPSDVYCSNGYYRFPANAMQEKEWRGADLIFDIDGKDLDLPCIPSHTYLLCKVCGSCIRLDDNNSKEEGYVCASCGGRAPDLTSIPCDRCIDGSKKQVRLLMEFLTNDLGIEGTNISMYFSGNNGFHVHVSDPAFIPLDAAARSEIVGYISGIAFIPESIGVRKTAGSNSALIKFPKGGVSSGWRKRVAQKLRIDNSSAIKLGHIVEQEGGYHAFKAVLDSITKKEGVNIDPQVTTDIHRIFRMPGTLNSKSGLAKIRCADLNDFEPFDKSCFLDDAKVDVRVKACLKLKLNRKSFNLSRESVELPGYAGVYLICKGLAESN